MRLCLRSRIFSCVIALLLGGIAIPGSARERGPRVQVLCPTAPVAFPLDKQTALVYELDVTNFEMAPLTLKRVQIFANAANGEQLVDLGGDALSADMTRAGAMGGKNSQTIDAGAMAVMFLWVGVKPGEAIPSSLHHRMVFAAAQSDGGASSPDSILEDFVVAVSADEAPVIGYPFRGGVWFAGDGPANDSDHRRSLVAIDGSVHDAQRFASDWMKIGPNGDTHHDDRSKNENFWGYGEPVLAVADGEITDLKDGIPENRPRQLPSPVTLDNIAGNYVILQFGPKLFAGYAHLQMGSIRVHLHERVHRGDVLALLGNTGQATGPHLHFQIMDANSVLQAEGFPFVFENFTYFGPGADYELNKHVSVPWTHSGVPGGAVIEIQPSDK